MTTPDFRMTQKGTGAELFIYDDIGPEWAGMIGAKTVRDALAGIDPKATLNVRINSPGGSVFEGVAIYNQLCRHEGKVIVDIDGMALSAASLIAMGGHEIRIAENAMLMIHNPWGIAMGGASDLRATADVLAKIGGALADTYAARTGKPVADIVKLMADETWFDAKEAVAEKFANSITPAKAGTKPQASLKFQPQNMPHRFAAMFNPSGKLTGGASVIEMSPVSHPGSLSPAASAPSTMTTNTHTLSDDIEGDWNANRNGCRDSFKRLHAYKAFRMSNAATLSASDADDHDDHDTGGTITATKPTTAPAKAAKNPQAIASHLWAMMSDRERRRFPHRADFNARVAAETKPGQLTGLHESRYPAN